MPWKPLPHQSVARTVALLLVLLAAACRPEAPAEPAVHVLFNGTDLTGWTPKITGHPLGEDPYGTFRVEDGLLTVGYEGYEGDFADRFGHLFFDDPFSDYVLTVEYRIFGEQADGGPGWAFKNSGVMFHSQDPATMTVGQDFPISIEVQFLGGDGENPRPTANLCTPGTHVTMADELVETHCIEAQAPTIHDDRWVTVEIEVRDGTIVHRVDGIDVMTYSGPVVGGGVVNGHDPADKVDGTALERGWIALQSESHPIQFRRVELRELQEG